jgi:hypothetical protein
MPPITCNQLVPVAKSVYATETVCGGLRSLRSALLLSCLFHGRYSFLHIYYPVMSSALRFTALEKQGRNADSLRIVLLLSLSGVF